jgi:methylmalonyl-CoA/ethylmalonyl-CoA epimerase
MLSELGCVFHHIGVACRDLDAEAGPWLALGYKIEGADFEDPTQHIRGRFIIGPGPRLELLVPTDADSPITGMLTRGVKFYHQAFVASRFEEVLATLGTLRCKIVADPVPAVAFDSKRIAFLLTPNISLIEIIEGG